MPTLDFLKMHGLGNDFVIIDDRADVMNLGPAHFRFLADRRRGIGCDQVILLKAPKAASADLAMRIYNPDGSEAEACGNGTRCVAALLLKEGKDHAIIETLAGQLEAERQGEHIQIDMGPVRLDWRDIPLSQHCDTAHLPIEAGPFRDGVAVNIGNPHAVFFMDNADAIDLAHWGPLLEHHSLFPAQANIEAVTIIGPDTLRMRVWERGAGITQACGSGACAAAVASHRRGLTGRKVEVQLDGGRLAIEWLKDNHVLMSGPASLSFSGRVNVPDELR